jgi:hypothetical protein
MVFPPLAAAALITKRGRYWISADGIAGFANPGNPHYIDNGDGTFRGVSKVRWKENDWSVRVLISSEAVQRAIEGGGILTLGVDDDRSSPCRMNVYLVGLHSDDACLVYYSRRRA